MEESFKMGRCIEEAVCRCFGIMIEEIESGIRLDRKFTDCLHFIWYYRHYVERVSLNSLSVKYGRSTRNIRYAISKVRNGMRTQPYYKEMHERVLIEILRGEDS